MKSPGSLLAGAAFCVGLIAWTPSVTGQVPPPPAVTAGKVPEAAWRRLRGEIASLKRPRGLVTSVFVMDLDTGQVMKMDAGRAMPAASLIKVPVAVAVQARVAGGEVEPGRKIALGARHKAGGSGTLRRRKTGSEYDIETLLELMLQHSDNTATNMLTELVGLDEVNSACRSAGLKGTRMRRYVMDLAARKRGTENTTTAADMGRLLAALYYGKGPGGDPGGGILDILKAQKIRDRLPRHLPASTVVAHKTGFMNNALHDAGILYGRNHDYVICVLTTPRYPYFRSAKEYIGQVARTVYRYDRFMRGRVAPAAVSLSLNGGYNKGGG